LGGSTNIWAEATFIHSEQQEKTTSEVSFASHLEFFLNAFFMILNLLLENCNCTRKPEKPKRKKHPMHNPYKSIYFKQFGDQISTSYSFIAEIQSATLESPKSMYVCMDKVLSQLFVGF
jgi:hypothetical protein